MHDVMDYQDFLKNKVRLADRLGFDIDDSEINDALKPHQKAAVKWAVAGGRRALFEAFGLGKSIQQLEVLRIILTKVESGRGLIVCPLGVRQEFIRDAREILGWDTVPTFVRRSEEVDAPGIYITNYESVRDGKLDPNLFDAVSLDEASCFPAGTLVDTPKGFVPIESLRIGDKIMNANGVDYVKDTFRKEIHRAARIRVGSRTIISSDNHRFFTKRGWMRADQLHAGDSIMETSEAVRLLQTGYCAENLSGREKAVLQSILLSEMANEPARKPCEKFRVSKTTNGETGNARTDRRQTSQADFSEALRILRNRVHAETNRTKEPAILQQQMLSSLADEPTRAQGRGFEALTHIRSARETGSEHQGVVCVGLGIGTGRERENQVFESNEFRVFESEELGIPQISRGISDIDGRERCGLDRSTATATRRTRCRVDSRIFDFGETSDQRASNTFQRRSSASYQENSYRSGRAESSSDKSERTRQEARCLSSFARVDGIEILEQGHPDLDRFRDADGKLYFYDLTSTQHPSFSVDGLLVHNCLRGFGGTKTFREFMALFAGDRKTMDDRTFTRGIPYRFVATATPSPNEYIELLAYSAFLGVMEVSQAKTRFFKRNSEKADELTIHVHKEKEFWLWCSSWALFLQSPADLGYDATGYDLPEMKVHYHEVAVSNAETTFNRHGQGMLIRNAAAGMIEASREKRETLDLRVAKMLEIVNESPDDHFLLWHDLEAERHAICKAIPEAKAVFGSQDLDTREELIIDFSDGKFKYLAGKPVMLGSGCNFQRHCHKAIFVGIGYKFNDFIQAIYRLVRYLQTHQVEIHIIYAESEKLVLEDLLEKWERDKHQRAEMTKIIRKYGLSESAMESELRRGFGVERTEIKGKKYTVVNNDCIDEMKRLEENSIGLIVTSIPFSTQYEYSPNYADFGHTDNNDHFFEQMDFLTPEMYRVLMPGRIAAIHVKDRIVPGGMTGLGFQTVYPFHAQCIAHYTKHGFGYMGMKTIVTDVVRENNQTYRLAYTEQCKDGTKMGVGMPEYLLLLRKPQSDNSKAYADLPVVKQKSKYGLGRWQVDAHGFTRSSGNRPLSSEDLRGVPHDVIYKMFRKFSLENVYDFDHHVALQEKLREEKRLPVTFMLMPPQSWHEDVWTDITRMRTLNANQYSKGKQMHLCPLQLDIAERAIEQWSNEGETVLDPFGGLGTVAHCAVKLGRRGYSIELSPDYFADSIAYLEAAEQQADMPSLFDLIEAQEETAMEVSA